MFWLALFFSVLSFLVALERAALTSGAEVGLLGRVAARHGPRAQRKHQGLPGGLCRRPAPPPAVAAGEARVSERNLR